MRIEYYKSTGYCKDNRSLTHRAMWWKSYDEHIIEGKIQLRGMTSIGINACCIESYVLYYIISIIMTHFVIDVQIRKVIIIADAQLKTNFCKEETNETREGDRKEIVIAKTKAPIKLAGNGGG